MKPFTNSRVFILLLAVFLTACGGNQSKPEESGQTEFQNIDQVAGLEPVENAGPLTIEQRFGPNPYLSRAPSVPPEAGVEYGMALAALNAGDKEEAELQFLVLNENYATLSGPAYNLALMKYEQDDREEALKYVDTALSRNYYNVDARNLKAMILRANGDFSGAEKEYLELIGIWGGYIKVYRNLGILYDLYMGDQEKALVQYQLYNELLPEQDRQVYGWIVDIERRLAATKAQEQRLAEQQAAEAAAAQAAADAEAAEQAGTVEAGAESSEAAVPANDDKGSQANDDAVAPEKQES